MMHKAFEYEVKFGRDGRSLERRWSIGPVLITSIVALILALTGHTILHAAATLLKALKWW
jgi:hypothetical protein